MTETNKSGVADIVPSKPAPRECKNSRELKTHYPTLDDYLAVVDAAELHHFQFEGSSTVGHAYYQKGFQTIGEHFDTIIRAFAANARAGERERIAQHFDKLVREEFAAGNIASGHGFRAASTIICNLPLEQDNE